MPGGASSLLKHQLHCSLSPDPRPRLSAEPQEEDDLRIRGHENWEPGRIKVKAVGCKRVRAGGC